MADLRRIVERLAELDIHLELDDARPLGNGVVRTPTGKQSVAVLDGDDLSSQLRSLLVLHHEQERPLLIMMSRIGAEMATRLRASGMQFVDEAGNAWISYPGTHVDVRGRRQQPASAERESPPSVNLFSSKRAQVVFSVLTWPDLAAAPLRQLATVAGVSVGLVQSTMALLDERGYLRRDERGLRRGTELLDEWVASYPLGLARTLRIKDFAGDHAAAASQLGSGAHISGESAIPGLIKPETFTAYIAEFDPRIAIESRWRTDLPPNIHIRRKFWTSPAEWLDSPDGVTRTAPPVLLYADLVATRDSRLVEAAEEYRRSNARLRSL